LLHLSAGDLLREEAKQGGESKIKLFYEKLEKKLMK
jgi:hypothetical protein